MTNGLRIYARHLRQYETRHNIYILTDSKSKILKKKIQSLSFFALQEKKILIMLWPISNISNKKLNGNVKVVVDDMTD